jgi:hypothetical protein
MMSTESVNGTRTDNTTSPRKENLNLLVWIKLLHLFLCCFK